jgi:hypothetical protein
LGTIIRKIPLPTSDVSKSGILDVYGNNIRTSEGMLDMKQLEIVGNHFLEVLLKMKHNGAIDKTRAGFTALCNRLLCSNDARSLIYLDNIIDNHLLCLFPCFVVPTIVFWGQFLMLNFIGSSNLRNF